jgi:hypothetical protein
MKGTRGFLEMKETGTQGFVILKIFKKSEPENLLFLKFKNLEL